jgi:hypothetical protein
MAVDHLFGTEDDEDDERFAEPGVFVGTASVALVATGLLFRFVVRPSADDPERAAIKAIACSLLAVLALPLLFVAVPFPLAGAGVALGLIARDGRRHRLAAAAIALGAGVLVLGVAAYVGALVT